MQRHRKWRGSFMNHFTHSADFSVRIVLSVAKNDEKIKPKESFQNQQPTTNAQYLHLVALLFLSNIRNSHISSQLKTYRTTPFLTVLNHFFSSLVITLCLGIKWKLSWSRNRYIVKRRPWKVYPPSTAVASHFLYASLNLYLGVNFFSLSDEFC